MPLVQVVIVLVVVGFLLWAVQQYVPMDARIKQLLTVVVLIAVVLWLLNVFGVLHAIDTVSTPRRR